MRKYLYLQIFVIVLLIIVFASCKKEEEKPQATVIRPVRTIVVSETEKGRERSFSGVARAAVETRLSFRVGGEVDRLPVKVGMKLKKGDLIAGLDSADYELSVKQAQANLAQAQAQYTRAKSEYDRDRQLYEAGNISKSQLDRSLAAYQSGKAQTDAAGKSVELAKHQLKYTVLTAPLDGSIGSLPIDAHQTVAPGQTIATLTSGGTLEMATGIPESLISQVHVEAPAQIKFDAIPDKEFSARVIEVGVEATESTTYPVKLQIMENDKHLRPGMVGRVVFKFEAGQEFITIPLVSVATSAKGDKYVWVFKPENKNQPDDDQPNKDQPNKDQPNNDQPNNDQIDKDQARGKMERRPVVIGALTSNGLQIVKGLEPGEIIAVRGVHKILDNMEVRVLPSTDATRVLNKDQAQNQNQNQEDSL